MTGSLLSAYTRHCGNPGRRPSYPAAMNLTLVLGSQVTTIWNGLHRGSRQPVTTPCSLGATVAALLPVLPVRCERSLRPVKLVTTVIRPSRTMGAGQRLSVPRFSEIRQDIPYEGTTRNI